MIRQLFTQLLALGLLLFATATQAQQYRWVDEKGRVHYTDTPPPSAKSIRKVEVKTERPAEPREQTTFEILQAQKNFPVTLYTSPSCKNPCELARTALNKRGVPFSEVQVWNSETIDQLKLAAGSENVPALMVGRSAVSGFEQTMYDALLDSAGYPKLGVAPERSQLAPAPPEGYQPPSKVEAEPVKPEPTTATRPGRYDPSRLPANRPDKPGPYIAPDAVK
jgi:glutaredoxin